MSKKQYIQPKVLNKETVVPDQAIASCTNGTGGATYKFIGYSYQNIAGFGAIGNLPSNPPTTLEAARAKWPNQNIVAVYQISNGKTGWKYYIDAETYRVNDSSDYYADGSNIWDIDIDRSDNKKGYFVS